MTYAFLVLYLFFSSPSWARQMMTVNTKSKEHTEDYPLKELINSQYFRLSPTRQLEIKDLKGFITFSNENKTIQCIFQKERIPSNVKLELAAGSVWENSSGPVPPFENVYEKKDPNKPTELLLKLTKNSDTVDFKCQFTSLITGQFESSADEDYQRSRCETKGGVFTHYSRKEFDFACDYKLVYADLKKVLQNAGFHFESRKEPPEIAVVVLGGETKPTQIKKKARQPSSLKKR